MAVSASIGISLSSTPGDGTANSLMARADLALYRAKADGRNRFRFFEDSMEINLRSRRAIESQLRRAINTRGLELHYQPQVDIATDRITGLEALELIDSVLRETGLPPQRLEIEITENVLLHDTEATLDALNRLKALGIGIAMDDFGAGYSSLSYLRRFPFDKIKIDRAFIVDTPGCPEAAAIVRAAINLGRSLGMRSSVEGVETVDQLEVLRREGAQEAQGFYFGRPMPGPTLAAFLGRCGAVDPPSPLAA